MKKNPYRNAYIRDLNLPRWPLFFRDAMKAVADFNRTVVTDGVPRWPSNDQVPPRELLELWNYMNFSFDYEKTLSVLDAEQAQFLDEYRRLNTGRTRSEEELYEMRAAFGRGATVKDAITGDIIRL